MNRKLTPQEFKEIEHLVHCAITASTKRDASEYITRLNFLHRTMSYDVAGNIRNMFSELVGYTEAASGQVREKSHWESVARSALYKLESFGVGEDSSDE